MPKNNDSLPQWRGGESMRGKLRDKRADTKRDSFKRAMLERRRTNKRDNRVVVLQSPQFDEEEDLLLEDEKDALAQKPVTK
jgi:hypothetical protein